jgi:hypothetical protein
VTRDVFLPWAALVGPRAQRRDCPPNKFMRTYVETIAMIVSLLAAYFALLPLTI